MAIFGDNGKINLKYVPVFFFFFPKFSSFVGLTIIFILNNGKIVEIRNLDPKAATFWIDPPGNPLLLFFLLCLFAWLK